jgi:hypothetical protein
MYLVQNLVIPCMCKCNQANELLLDDNIIVDTHLPEKSAT